MNCESARETMSAFYDQELQPDLDAAAREHLHDCPDCAQHLIQFEELSKLAADLRQPEVPAGIWPAIDSLLNAPRHGGGRSATWLRRYSRAAIAATLFLGVSITLLAYWTWHTTDEHKEMAVIFGRYLDRFDEQPQRAQEVLLMRYDGRLLAPQQAAAEAKFKPNAPDELPQGFSRSGIYVLKMPCCTCTQTIYKDDNGRVLALFEHSDEQRSWFGDRPTITAQCHGKQTCLIQMRDKLAACWKSGTRHLTVVGARDVEQVAELVAFLDAQSQLLQTARGPT